MNPPLVGIRIIDATTRWGELAGKVLAELGAEVIKVEPRQGCESRHLGPFDGEGSLYWACVGAGKKSVVAEDPTPFLADADVFIESGRRRDLSGDFPALVHVSVTPFGTTGPLADAPAAEVTVEAAGGLTGLQGDPDRPPVPMGAMPQAAFHAGVQAAADIVVALYEREKSGLGQHLDVSAQACVVWTLMNATGYPPNTGRNPPGTSEFRGQPLASAARQRLRLPGIVQCRDGLIQVRFQMRHIGERTFDALLRWVEASDMNVPDNVRGMELRSWLAVLRAGELDLEAAQTAADLIEALLATKTLHEIQLYSAQHGLTLAAIHRIPDLLRDPQLADREFWLTADGRKATDGTARRVHAGPFARLSRTPLSLNRTAPALGSSQPPSRRPPKVAARAEEAPFAGLKVADFSWVGVGPMIGKALADHGATVVRIESENRVDLLRTAAAVQGRRTGSGSRAVHGQLQYLEARHDHRPQESGRTETCPSDGRLGGCGPGELLARDHGRFGLDWETLSADRDDLVMLSTSMRGQTGRERGYSGFGGQGACIAGLYNLVGWPDRQPSGPWGAYTDFISPRFGISVLVAALLDRRRTGLGQHIDLAQIECGIRFIEPLILDYAATGRVAERLGQASPSLDPHGVFPCAGEERYVAVGVETVLERRALAALLDGCELADWCARRCAFNAAAELRRVGVPAYAVMRPSDLYEDPQLVHRGFFETLDHPVMGPTPYDGPATIYSRTPQRLRSPAPCLGQHTERVASRLSGNGL